MCCHWWSKMIFLRIAYCSLRIYFYSKVFYYPGSCRRWSCLHSSSGSPLRLDGSMMETCTSLNLAPIQLCSFNSCNLSYLFCHRSSQLGFLIPYQSRSLQRYSSPHGSPVRVGYLWLVILQAQTCYGMMISCLPLFQALEDLHVYWVFSCWIKISLAQPIMSCNHLWRVGCSCSSIWEELVYSKKYNWYQQGDQMNSPSLLPIKLLILID